MQALWQHLRGCRLGVWFRRQVPLGRFIVDFLAPSARLVVEVDGGYHSTRAGADARRDHQLALWGYRSCESTPSSRIATLPRPSPSSQAALQAE